MACHTRLQPQLLEFIIMDTNETSYLFLSVLLLPCLFVTCSKIHKCIQKQRLCILLL